MSPGFVYLDEAVDSVLWDAKYAGSDNFTGGPVDGYATDRVVTTAAVAAALQDAQGRAAERGLALLVWDGYRPQRAVDHFVRWAQEPECPRLKSVFHPRISRAAMFEQGYIACSSGHTRGGSLDLTLVDSANGLLLDMGGRHDLMDESSHHASTEVGPVAAENRRILCGIMLDSGFQPYPQEWWHYTLADEPFPDHYFDFPLN
ncbi:D-Ala-D-Ala dipeptidase VanX [Rathayibacter rathayi]|uniref:M15 family metallopeptidase n=1 Tax=Rathayibacter rathayi TaxID=33887 RepID=UPI000CE8FB47|nr:M15 family metallopeptidase [Rathayibacter rathayi]PPF20938.1 D-Ala-D-Ala dipeptidase VanX [Rathayibacter rathayi]PPH18986.1 D-Ala-D-Ala dipeptidase VanX [Rathayibacter rathayi]